MTVIGNLSRKVGLYMRLSHDDEKEGESLSIEHQRVLLHEFVTNAGGEVVQEYADDGYSGTDFERPAVKRMLDDVRLGRIDTVVVKDLSRFGRNYIQVGQYIDYIFPAHGIRFIAVSDNIDTADRNSAAMDMLPIMNVFNEWHAANTSKKIRAVLDASRRAGKFTGWSYPYGYRVGNDEKRSAVIDESAAVTVRRIYDMRLLGFSAARIARTLTDEKIPSPSAHYMRSDGGKNSAPNDKWTPKTVLRILSDPTYTGSTVQRRFARVSYKNKRTVSLPASEWIVKDNAHEPIVDKSVWERVQYIGKAPAPRGRADGTHTVRPLSGAVVCADCGKKLKYKRAAKGNGGFVCRTYTDLGKKYCSSHYVSERFLESVVLADIRDLFAETAIDVEKLKARFEKDVFGRRAERVYADEKNIGEWNIRLNELDRLITSVFEEHVLNGLSADLRDELLSKYVAEREQIKNNIAEATDRIERARTNEDRVCFDNIMRHELFERFTREMCLLFVDRISVGEKNRSNGSRSIHIYYKFKKPDACK